MDKKFVIFGEAGGHPKYRENADRPYKIGGRSQYVDQSLCCVYCGKYAPSAETFVYLSGPGEIIEARDGNDDLGLYPVGSECVKLAHAAGVPVYDSRFQRVE